MSLENQTASYTIEVKRTGDGATLAVQDFQQVQAAVNAANQQLAAVSPTMAAMKNNTAASREALHELHLTSKATTSAFHEFHNIGLLLGSQTMPGLTNAVAVATGAMHSMRAASMATGLSLGAVGIAVAGLAALVATLEKGWEALEARQEAKESTERLKEQQEILKQHVEKVIQLAELEQRIDAEQAASFRARMDGELQLVTAQLRQIVGTKDQIEANAKLRELNSQMFAETLDAQVRERFELSQTFQQRKQQIEELSKKGGGEIDPETTRRSLDTAKQAYDFQSDLLEQKTQAAAATAQLDALEKQLTATALSSGESRRQLIRREYDERIAAYNEMYATGIATETRLAEMAQSAADKETLAFQRAGFAAISQAQIMEQVFKAAMEKFSSGLADAIVDFASGTKSAEAAFKEFAASVLKQIAQMILQQEILNALKVASSFLFGSGGTATADAMGGVHFAASGLAGVSSVSSPTYFPKFNVVAGEAGREMLTVLARPRRMEIGGMEAVVGKAGSRTLAITDANDLANGGGGGGSGKAVIDLNINMEPGLRAELINQSVQGAEIHLTQKVQQPSAFRSAIKKSI